MKRYNAGMYDNYIGEHRREEDHNSEALRRLNTVTPLSRWVALILFIALPILGFWFGVMYQSEYQKSFPETVFIPIQTMPAALVVAPSVPTEPVMNPE